MVILNIIRAFSARLYSDLYTDKASTFLRYDQPVAEEGGSNQDEYELPFYTAGFA